jgi:hypothetical protein
LNHGTELWTLRLESQCYLADIRPHCNPLSGLSDFALCEVLGTGQHVG